MRLSLHARSLRAGRVRSSTSISRGLRSFKTHLQWVASIQTTRGGAKRSRAINDGWRRSPQSRLAASVTSTDPRSHPTSVPATPRRWRIVPRHMCAARSMPSLPDTHMRARFAYAAQTHVPTVCATVRRLLRSCKASSGHRYPTYQGRSTRPPFPTNTVTERSEQGSGSGQVGCQD